uniref:Uncharacterized protein n=1 Tax=Avena sativa TaxID=4498 RepID=A0ACD5WUY7_AVESA
MEYVTTLPEINKKIMSTDFSKYLTKIDTADAVLSHNDGVLIVVTGSLSSDNDVRQQFTQTFFLAPQETGGYFVLTDILRFLSERNQENGSNQKDHSIALSVADTTPAAAEEPLTTYPVVETNNVPGEELLNPTVNGTTVENNPTVNSTTVENNPTVNAITVENNVIVEPPVKVTKEDVKKTPVAASPPPAQKDIPKKHPISASPPPAQKDIPKKHPISASPPPAAQKDSTKKTYASIVKDSKEGQPAVKPKIVKPVSKPPTQVVDESAKPLQVAETTPTSTSVTKSSTSNDEQGYSIFVKGLPSRSTVETVGKEFKKFGAIKPGGIQVRSNKFDEFCFGFVEFESLQSMQAAIEASPIFIAEKEIIIQKKRTNTRVVDGVIMNAGGGDRFQYMRGANNFRGQGGGYVNNANYRGADNFNRRDGGGEYFNQRNDGGEYFNRRDDGGNHYNRRNDDSNFSSRRDDGFRHQNVFSGRVRGSPQGNGYHQNGNGFHQPRPFQNENGRYASVNNNGTKQTPVAARVNKDPKQTPVPARVDKDPKQTPVAARVDNDPKQTPDAA